MIIDVYIGVHIWEACPFNRLIQEIKAIIKFMITKCSDVVTHYIHSFIYRVNRIIFF
ncbi:hypothetical protein D3C81_1413320 [compost metagenome]